MKIAFIARSSLYATPGGDTIQVNQTARNLGQSGIRVDIKLSSDTIDYAQYDLLHFFNITRPADILRHVQRSSNAFVISTILIDYGMYDKYYRKGFTGFLFRTLSFSAIEYLKTIGRYLTRTDRLSSVGYLWKGHQRAIQEILDKAAMLLPNSTLEQAALEKLFVRRSKSLVIPNGIDENLFILNERVAKNPFLVLCIARVEGLKNQHNLIKALNDSPYHLIIIGSAAPNHQQYYDWCKRIASSNITFIDHLPQEELVSYYQQAKVHVLPSWFETCGLASLEAGVMGCNIVITEKGYTREYFEDYAFYCDPASPQSIREAIEKAARAPFPAALRDKILTHYTWQKAAQKTLAAYKQVLEKQ